MKTIKEKNRLIAEFMGFVMVVENYHGINIIRSPKGNSFDLSQLKYHTSWDWLIPVIKKIKPLVCEAEFTHRIGECLHYEQDLSKIHNACYEFIQWYNENK